MMRFKFPIPSHWSPEQAKAVWEILYDLSDAVWNAHENKILDAMHHQQSMPEPPATGADDFDDDDIPF